MPRHKRSRFPEQLWSRSYTEEMWSRWAEVAMVFVMIPACSVQQPVNRAIAAEST